MKKSYFIYAGMLLFAWACSGVKVTTDLDKDADFTKYKTVSFLGWQDDIDQLINNFDQERFKTALKSEMDKRNLEIVDENGDMVVSLFLVLDQKTSTTAYTNYYGGTGWGYGRARWGWGTGHSTTTYTESDYLKGTMVVDAFDQQSKDLIWQGVGVGTVQSDPEKRETSIPKAVAKVFKDFPIAPVEQ